MRAIPLASAEVQLFVQRRKGGSHVAHRVDAVRDVAATLTTLYEKLHLGGRKWDCAHGPGAICDTCEPDNY